MLTRDEVIQLILYLIVATALLLASRVRAETFKLDEADARIPAMRYSMERGFVQSRGALCAADVDEHTP